MKYSKKYLAKGFTLIELLIVIAIIGILSAIVMASLNTARSKGSDAAIKSNLDNVRPEAAIFYDGNNPNTYSGLCLDPKIVNIMTSAMAVSGDTGVVANRCFDTADHWLVWVPLKTSTSTAWCVDDVGDAKEIDISSSVPGDTTPCS